MFAELNVFLDVFIFATNYKPPPEEYIEHKQHEEKREEINQFFVSSKSLYLHLHAGSDGLTYSSPSAVF
jgi:hypothetical protein